VDPLDSIADYGTDALRYALLTSSARGLGEIGFMYVHVNICQPCVQIDQGLRVGKILRRIETVQSGRGEHIRKRRSKVPGMDVPISKGMLENAKAANTVLISNLINFSSNLSCNMINMPVLISSSHVKSHSLTVYAERLLRTKSGTSDDSSSQSMRRQLAPFRLSSAQHSHMIYHLINMLLTFS
jgi:hypothetical protein